MSQVFQHLGSWVWQDQDLSRMSEYVVNIVSLLGVKYMSLIIYLEIVIHVPK